MDIEEEVSEIVKEAADTNPIVAVVVGLVGLGIGLGVGYILGRRNKYEVIKLGDRLPPTRPPKVVIEAEDLASEKLSETGKKIDLIRAVEPEDAPKITVNEKVVETNVFAHAEVADDWDYDKEVERRNPLAPYIIHRDEFFAEEMETENFIQSQLTFYAGDEVLIDEDEKPIYNHDQIVGPLLFGHGSEDPNIVYVRNMTRQMEYEITRDPGHYRVEILGLEMEHQETEAEKRKAKRQQQRLRPE